MEKEYFELLRIRKGENTPIQSQLMQLMWKGEGEMWPEHGADSNCMTASWGKAKDTEAQNQEKHCTSGNKSDLVRETLDSEFKTFPNTCKE